MFSSRGNGLIWTSSRQVSRHVILPVGVILLSHWLPRLLIYSPLRAPLATRKRTRRAHHLLLLTRLLDLLISASSLRYSLAMDKVRIFDWPNILKILVNPRVVLYFLSSCLALISVFWQVWLYFYWVSLTAWSGHTLWPPRHTSPSFLTLWYIFVQGLNTSYRFE